MKKTPTPRSSLTRRNLKKFLSNKLAVAGCVMTLLVIALCIAAPLLTPYDPSAIDVSHKDLPPSSEYLLGTDRLGRDLLARLLYGGRISILVSVTSAAGAVGLGVILGCISAFYGRGIDKTILYISELFQTFPQILLILLCVGIVGQSTLNLVIIFIATGWPGTYRIVRSKIISLREEPFVESCVANGISGRSIMFHHLLPNTLGPVTVDVTLTTAGFILAEAGLSFLGMGCPPQVPTWGNIINAAKTLNVIQNYPLLWIAPGIAISLFVLSINFFGDGLRDVFDSTQ